jgi:hypothetical protein
VRLGFARTRRRVLICIIAVPLLMVGASWSYAKYEARRAKLLLADAAHIRIGHSEASIQPLLRRFGGGTCVDLETPEQDTKVDWWDNSEHEHWLRNVPDCSYFVEIDPWASPLSSVRSGFAESKAYARAKLAMWAIPGRVRSLLGMREWNTYVSISVRGGHVTAVRAGVYVEHRGDWLGHRWELLKEMPYDPYGRPSLDYSVDGAFLTFPQLGSDSGPGETAIITHMTPKATKDQIAAAQNLNMSCLTRRFSCKGMCDLSHQTIEYLKEHPDAARGYIAPDCQ